MSPEAAEAMPAATVVLVRDAAGGGIETLMLRKNSKIAFGGMWVFPGGRVDSGDEDADRDEMVAARHAAVREALEETGLTVQESDLVPFSHWVPPPVAPKRFATWFFLAAAPVGAVTVDGSEIHEHQWLRPSEAMRLRDEGEIEFVPPTWMTLHRLAQHSDVASVLDDAKDRDVDYFETRIARIEGGIAALWAGDAGYETIDATAPGARHRLCMLESGWRYEHTG
jgi:8-oxo-dGTP pyrophosphatase MutT (NUDIX family)